MSNNPPPPSAAANLARAVRQAAEKGRQPSAQLGTVVRGTPTLDVLLDTGQEVPQCAGPSGLQPGDRVLAHYINNGHDLAVQPMGSYLYSIIRVRVVGGSPTTVYNTNQGVPASSPHADGVQVNTSGIFIVSCQYQDGSGPAPWTHPPSGHAIGTDEIALGAGELLATEDDDCYLTVDWRAPWFPTCM